MTSTLILLAAASVLQGRPADAPKALPITFTSKEGGFSVILPAKPIEAIKEVPVPGGMLVNKVFQSSDGKSFFTVICADYPGGIPAGQSEAMLNGIKVGYVSSTNGKVTEERKITFADLPAREVTLEIGDAVQRARYFLRENRIYQILVAQSKANDDPEAFRRFVASFQLQKIQGGLKDAPVAPADWVEYRPEGGGFRVLMIGRPMDQTQKAASPAGPVEMRVHTSTNGLGESFMVVISPGSKAANGLAPDAVLDNVISGAVAGQPGSKMIRQKPIELDGVPGREVEIGLPPNLLIKDLTFFVHYYLTRDRLYQVAFVGSRANIPSKPVTEFLDSFRLDPAASGPKKESKP